MNYENVFEFDAVKSQTNKDKHGIDFEQATAIFMDERLLVFDAYSHDEPRFVAIGAWSGKVWAVVFMIRKGLTRLISVRRARTQEIKRYECQESDSDTQ